MKFKTIKKLEAKHKRFNKPSSIGTALRIEDKLSVLNEVVELLDEGCGTKEFEGHYKCRKGSLCPRCEELKSRIIGE